jgi:hypothetical protein
VARFDRDSGPSEPEESGSRSPARAATRWETAGDGDRHAWLAA